jgi:Whirly transcription factor
MRSVALVLLLLTEFSQSFSLTRSICRTSIRSNSVESSARRSSTTKRQSSSDSSQERTFANYVIYKSKAAVSLKVIPPTFQSSGTKSRTVSREGGLFFEFALSAGPKEYDWMKKGTFLLSAAECGELLLFDASRPNLEFFHDPNMGAANAGISAEL